MGRGRGRGRGSGRGDRNRAFGHSDDDGLEMHAQGAFKGSVGHSGNINRSDTESARPTGVDLAVHSKTPKFLQPYAHLLEKGNKKPRRVRVESEDEGDAQDDRGDADAIMRALEDQPDMKTNLQAAEVKKMEAEAAKERGNDAFKAKDFEAAIQHYTTAINADNTNAAYYSNRSAAHASVEKWEEARVDGARAANLRPAWSKAWTRLGAALMGLQDYSEAKEAYGKAMELEPDDKTINNAWIKADYEERQASQSGRLAFNKRKIKGAPASATTAAPAGAGNRARKPGVGVPVDGPQQQGSGKAAPHGRVSHRGSTSAARDQEGAGVAQPAAKKAKRAVLSFGDDSDEDADE